MESIAATWDVTSLDGEPVSYWGYFGEPEAQVPFASVGKCREGWLLSIHDGRDTTRSLWRLVESAERGKAVAERWARPRREALAARGTKGLPNAPETRR